MKQSFKMIDLGLMSYVLDIEVHQDKEGIFMSQQKYATEILKKFKMDTIAERVEMKKKGNEELVNPTYFKSIVGSLRYLTSTRPDIVYGVALISLYMKKSYQSYLQAAKRIFSYVNGTRNHKISFSPAKKYDLVGYTDSDWAGDVETRKSTSAYVFYLGNGIISWSSKKQPVVALNCRS